MFEDIIKENQIRFQGSRDIECAEGWTKLIKEFFIELDTFDPQKSIKIFCIKEKFGFLEIQCDHFPDGQNFEEFHNLTSKYRHLSKSFCEVCGNSGKLRSNGTWLSVTCEVHKR